MGLEFEYFAGQTPLDYDEKEGLLIPTVTTRGELDEFEQLNIEEAIQSFQGRSLKPHAIFTEKFIRNLHVRMFGNIWSWAGSFRKSNKNLGIDKWQIPVAVKDLCDNAIFWVENETFSPDEIAIRFKHRIVCIHCFPNGNGRHSRLMADIIIANYYGSRPFSWGAAMSVPESKNRTTYLEALRMADCGDFAALLDFART